MQLVWAVVVALFLVSQFLLLAVSTHAASRVEQRECSDSLSASQITACTRLIDDETSRSLDRAVAYCNRGLAWFGKASGRRALADITSGLRIAPSEPWCHTALAIYHHRNSDYVLAAIEYDRSIRLKPSGNAFAYLGRGISKLDRGDSIAGSADVVKARAEMPDVSNQFRLRYGIVLRHTVAMPI